MIILLIETESKFDKCSFMRQNTIKIKQLASYIDALIIPNLIFIIPIKIHRGYSVEATNVSFRDTLKEERDDIQTGVYECPSRKKNCNLWLTMPLCNIGTSSKRVHAN